MLVNTTDDMEFSEEDRFILLLFFSEEELLLAAADEEVTLRRGRERDLAGVVGVESLAGLKSSSDRLGCSIVYSSFF